MSEQARYLIEIASGQITGAPARAQDIARYLGPEYKPGYSWCAGFAAWCLMTAGYKAPAGGAGRRGARALTKWLAAESGWVIAPPARNPDLSVLRPGDVACWRRVRIGWQCHVVIITDVHPLMICTIGGNESGQVRRAWLSPDSFQTRLRGLYGVVRPQEVCTL